MVIIRTRVHWVGVCLSMSFLTSACDNPDAPASYQTGGTGAAPATSMTTGSVVSSGASGSTTSGVPTSGAAGSDGAQVVGPAGVAGSPGAAGTSVPVAGTAGSAVAGARGVPAAGSAGMQPVAGSAGASGTPTMSTMSNFVDRPRFVATGMPITAPEKQWTWVGFPDTKCRDGSAAGLVINKNAASKNLVVFMEAGGACFDPTTCAVNPASISSQSGPVAEGIFDRSRAENPIADWNWVYVPYCTGDVHLGTNDASEIDGVPGAQHFVGRLNVEAFLNRLVPTFSDVEAVLVTGTSAGGFAASATGQVVAWAFEDQPKVQRLAVIDDSGPPMSRDFLPACLTETWKKVWGLDKGVIEDCGAECSMGGDFEMQVLDKWLKNPDKRFRFGLIEADSDAIIRGFYGIGTNNGANDCQGTLLLTPMDAALFKSALLDFRMRVQADERFGTYYPPGDTHTWLQGPDFYTTKIGGVAMVDWFQNLLDGKPVGNVGP